jgi:hypothetical protein
MAQAVPYSSPVTGDATAGVHPSGARKEAFGLLADDTWQ